jgi:anaerobic magnesium-protoporphyrin IX monomethyl ester cyclase
MSKVLLIQPTIYERKLIPPLGIGYLAASLKNSGHEFELLHLTPTDFFNLNFDKYIAKSSPEIVGVTVYNIYYEFAKTIVKTVKMVNPDVLTVFGGPAVSLAPDYALKDSSSLDVVCIGEGEKTIVELAEKADLSSIAGIAYRDGGNQIVKTFHRPPVENIDTIRSPYIDNVFNLDMYRAGNVITARGCPYSCVYCLSHVFFGRKIRFHSVNRVLDEMEIISKKFNYIQITDDTFTINQNRVKEICEGIIKRKLDVSIWCETRVDRVSNSLLKLMKKSGVDFINFGVESIKNETLKVIKKGIALGQVKKAVKWAKEAGIKVSLSFIVGLPFEKKADIFRTIDFCKRMDADLYYFNNLAILPKTELYENCRKYGIKLNPDISPMDVQSSNMLRMEDLVEIRKYVETRLPNYVFIGVKNRQYGHVNEEMLEKVGISSSINSISFLLKKESCKGFKRDEGI